MSDFLQGVSRLTDYVAAQAEAERAAWLNRQLASADGALRYSGGPHLSGAVMGIGNALAMFSPGADVVDAAAASGQMADAAAARDSWGFAGGAAYGALAGLDEQPGTL